MYCYGITSQYCWGQDDCYQCSIILIINEEKRKRMGTFPPCEILDQGRTLCRFNSCKHCRTAWKTHKLKIVTFFLFRKNSISKKMSCIAHVCKCLFEKTLVHLATDFENEYFINVRSVDRVLSQFKRMIPEYRDFFAITYHDVITMYDGDSYFFCLRQMFT